MQTIGGTTRIRCGSSILLLLATTFGVDAQVTALTSPSSTGAAGNADSVISSTQATCDFGRWTAFASAASDLVAGDTNNAWDVFVRDRTTGATIRVSLSSAGQQAAGDSGWGGVAGTTIGGVAISLSGRFVVFPSRAIGLVGGGASAFSDIYIHDRDADSDGIFDEAGAVSTLRVTASTTGTRANGHSHWPSVAWDGTVVFSSDASDLVTGDNNAFTDVFYWDGSTISRLSVDTGGGDPNGPSTRPLISAFFGQVAFSSDATDLIASDSNSSTDAFVTTTAGGVRRISERADGSGGNGASMPTSISRLGDLVVFDTAACNLLDSSCTDDSNGAGDVYLVDRDADRDLIFHEAGDVVLTRVSVSDTEQEATGASGGGAIAPGANVVAFRSAATNLTAGGDPDGSIENVFLRDLSTQTTTHVGVLPGGGRANTLGVGVVSEVSVSTEGGMVVFGAANAQPRQVYLFDAQVLDTDGDSLLDSWEIAGIDSNADGTTDLTLPNADAAVPDIFIEIDAMVGMLPSPQTLAFIQNVFLQQDAVQARLRLIVDETNIPPQTWSADINPITWPPEYTPFKNARFGTPAERASPNWPNIRQAKLWAHRYCIFADQNTSNTIAGMGEMPGNDFFLTLGGVWSFWGSSPAVQTGVFLHELGHNLNLNHGGGLGISSPAQRAIDNKPNYHSVMNGTWTTPQTGYASSWIPGYSIRAFTVPNSFPPTFIDEFNLFEADGLGGWAGLVVPVGPPPMRLVNETGGVDFNRDGNCCTVLPGVSADLTHLAPGMAAPSPNQPLFSHDDWSNLQIQIGRIGPFAASAHGTSLPTDEYTFRDFQTLETVGDWDERLDTYALNEPLYAIGGWETWCDGGADAFVSDRFAKSLPHSMQILPGSDIARRFQEDSGRLTFSAGIYVPSWAAGVAYIIGLNDYCGDGHNWSMQVEFNADEGVVRDFAGAALPIALDRWAELVVEIDLDADLYSIFYDGLPLAEGLVWSEHVSGSFGEPGEARLRAFDIFSDSLTEMYLDDLALSRPDRNPPEPCPADLAEPLGVLDLADINTFVAGFLSQDPISDIDNNGIFDLADINTFIHAFTAGCP